MARLAGKPRIKRRYPRVPMRALVRYRSSNVDLAEETRDIGLGGMFIATEMLDAVGTPAELRLRIPGREQELVCRGVVRWTTLDEEILEGRVPNLSGMGLEFDGCEEMRGELVRVFGERILPPDVITAGITFAPPTLFGGNG